MLPMVFQIASIFRFELKDKRDVRQSLALNIREGHDKAMKRCRIYHYNTAIFMYFVPHVETL
jgi:hypothetical protein